MARAGRNQAVISREKLDYETARLPRQVTTAVTWYMEQKGIKRADLAQRLGVTPGRVSQILSGDENLTLHTLAAVCAALDARLEARLVDDDHGNPAVSRTGNPYAPVGV